MITIARPEVHDLLTVGLAVLFGAGLSGILFLVGMFFSTQWAEWRLRHGHYLDRRGRPRRGTPDTPDMQLVRLDPANIWEMRAYAEPVEMCIRDRGRKGRTRMIRWTRAARPVSYTHLDVYKRQATEKPT